VVYEMEDTSYSLGQQQQQSQVEDVSHAVWEREPQSVIDSSGDKYRPVSTTTDAEDGVIAATIHDFSVVSPYFRR
jgi:hypothetical protein